MTSRVETRLPRAAALVLAALFAVSCGTDAMRHQAARTSYRAGHAKQGAEQPRHKAVHPRDDIRRARNVILLIGDGMGPVQVAAAAAAAFGQSLDANGAPWKLHMETLDHTGYVTTWAGGSFVTDSAAAAGAIATGIKQTNRMLNLPERCYEVPECERRYGVEGYRTILEIARDRGRATGLVTSVPIDDATPAAFGARTGHRTFYNEIMKDYLDESRPDVLLGGGYFADNAALLRLARAKGYAVVVNDLQALRQLPSGPVIGYFDVDGNRHLTYENERVPSYADEPNLLDLAAEALRLLEPARNGFFLMIEGGAIDWASHAHNRDAAIAETLEFDNVVGLVLDWVNAGGGRNDETLVIVTADHETGGLTLTGPYGGALPKDRPASSIEAAWTTRNHTAAYVPVYASGPCSSLLAGKVDNTEIFRAMKRALE